MENHKVVGTIDANFIKIDESGEEVETVSLICSCNEFKINFLLGNPLMHSSLFIRSHLLKKHEINYDKRFHCDSGYHLVFQCSKFFKILDIPDSLVKYRINNNEITNTKIDISCNRLTFNCCNPQVTAIWQLCCIDTRRFDICIKGIKMFRR